MPIGCGSVSFYGSNKPGNGAAPIRTGPPPSLTKQPFGKDPGVDWTTGKHLPLVKPVITENELAVINNIKRNGLDGMSLNDVNALQQLSRDAVWDSESETWTFPGLISDVPSLPVNPGADVTTLGAAEEGSETASTDTWTNTGAIGLSEWYQTRTVYNDAGDEVLYEYFRKRTYDQYGRLYSVSAETRVIVDTPVAES